MRLFASLFRSMASLRCASLGVLALFVACSGSIPAGADGAPQRAPAAAAPQLPPTVTASEADIARLAARQNQFGFDLWRQLASTPGNLALSPASLAIAFGMTSAGARGATADELRRVLHFDGIADPHAPAGATIGRWNVAGRPYALSVANQLFGEQSTGFEAPFLDLVRAAYGAPLEPVDFRRAFDAARVHINDWVAGRTADRITDLLPQGSLDADTSLVLVNAIYFKGAWQRRFEASATRDRDFHRADGTTHRVPFMHQRGPFAFGATSDAQVLELPYLGGDLVMDVVLPKDGLAALGELTPARLDGWLAALAPASEAVVALPRFRIETASLALKPALTALGLDTAFTDQADFSGMSTTTALHISDAFHKVFVDVNEEGTEAAAATAVVMTRESAHIAPEFVADQPFLFFIRDVRTGHVLFMGRVSDPA